MTGLFVGAKQLKFCEAEVKCPHQGLLHLPFSQPGVRVFIFHLKPGRADGSQTGSPSVLLLIDLLPFQRTLYSSQSAFYTVAPTHHSMAQSSQDT